MTTIPGPGLGELFYVTSAFFGNGTDVMLEDINNRFGQNGAPLIKIPLRIPNYVKAAFLLKDPDLIGEVLSDSDRYPRGPIYTDLTTLVLGENALVIAEGSKGRDDRRGLQHALSTKVSNQFATIAFQEITILLDQWVKNRISEVDIVVELKPLIFKILFKFMFGRSPNDYEFKLFNDVLSEAYYIHLGSRYISRLTPWFHIRKRNFTKIYLEFAEFIINEAARIKEDEATPSLVFKPLLSYFIKQYPDNQQYWIDQARMFMSAGSDTSTSALISMLYLSSINSRIDTRVNTLVSRQKISDPHTFVSWVNETIYFEYLFNETLRFASPAQLWVRTKDTDDLLGDFDIPRGAVLLTAPALLHFDPKYYPNPNQFNPLRWENSKPQPNTFLSFSNGARRCPGDQFAEITVKTLYAAIRTRFNLQVKQKKVKYSRGVTYQIDRLIMDLAQLI